MKLSTSLNIYANKNETYENKIRRAHECGFDCLDLNATDYMSFDSFYTSQNWRENMKKIKEYADSIGVKFTQSHAFCFAGEEPEDAEYQIKKSIEASAIAGVPWVVIHPWQTEFTEKKDILDRNIEILGIYAEYAKEYNTGIAVENMFKHVFWFGEEVKMKAFDNADDLIYVADRLNETYGNVGICWDTGHANLSMKSQYDDIVKIGKRLKTLHIADNGCQYDDHTAPFMGYIKWDEIMKALKTIGYEGTFNYETHNFTRGLPDELKDDAVKLLCKIGNYIINLG